MSGFFAQLHLHTAESSACGKAGGAQMIRACHQAGYKLVVVTDHFFNANINCPHIAPWEEKVNCLMKGYRAAKKEGDRLGVTVLFGWETNTDGPEVLTYGLGEEFLLAHPDVAEWDIDRYVSQTRAAGAFLTHAHPFRKAYYIEPFAPRPKLYDAFEVYNGRHAGHHDWDARALQMALENRLIQVAGSDAHAVDEVDQGAMELPWPVHDVKGLIEALKTRKARVVETLKGAYHV